jgi:serine-type D-Ala-D-Ala carboxypeptidase (penicillin-binding protein 5/6)
VATSRRPPIYSTPAGTRRGRRLPPVSPLRLALVVIVLGALGAFALMVWRVLPLTDREAGRIPSSALSGSAAPQPGGDTPSPGGLAPFDLSGASSKRLPGVRATAGIVVDVESGRVLWARRPHAKRPIASLTKLMTALLVERGSENLRRKVTITPEMTGELGYTIGLQPGDEVSVRDLLAAAMIASANDASDALAVHRSGSVDRFVRLMNREAKTLGLRDTRYSNPSGIIDTGNHSSAWDVASVARLYMARPALARLAGMKLYQPASGSSYVSRNRLLWDEPTAIGIKTGSTDLAGECLAAAARKDGRTLIAVVLDANGDEFAQAQALLRFGFRQA